MAKQTQSDIERSTAIANEINAKHGILSKLWTVPNKDTAAASSTANQITRAGDFSLVGEHETEDCQILAATDNNRAYGVSVCSAGFSRYATIGYTSNKGGKAVRKRVALTADPDVLDALAAALQATANWLRDTEQKKSALVAAKPKPAQASAPAPVQTKAAEPEEDDKVPAAPARPRTFSVELAPPPAQPAGPTVVVNRRRPNRY